jgi:hypothetical protein
LAWSPKSIYSNKDALLQKELKRSKPMLDFSPLRNKEVTWAEFTADMTKGTLHDLTNEMVDTMLDLIKDCTDEDVIFVPEDSDAKDTYAEDEADVDLAWTLGHVIVHTTASSEESAFLAAELARGVPIEPRRSRSELPWQAVTTIEQCRHRLEESRRMRLASLAMWPDEPYLENNYQISERFPVLNAIMRFVFGLWHDDSHLGQIAEIVRQANAARE